MLSTWEKLAAGEDLPASVALDVWQSGDHKAMRKLASARELPRDIEEMIVAGADPAITEAWLTQKRSGDLLEKIDETLGPEVRGALARQPHISEQLRRRLARHGEERVLQQLLNRVDLRIEEYDDYLAGYVCAKELRRDTYGANLLSMIGNHEATWLKLLDRIGPRQAGLLGDAAAMTDREATHRLTHTTLLRIADQAPEAELLRAARNLITGRWLTPGDYLELAAHPKLQAAVPELRRRAGIDTTTTLRVLTECAEGTGDCDDAGHEEELRRLLPYTTIVSMTWSVPARAALRHRIGTDWEERLEFYQRLTNEESRALAEELADTERYEEAAEIIEGSRHTSWSPRPEVRVALARCGSRHAYHGTQTEEDIEIVLDHYQPVRELLEEPTYAGRIARLVAERDREERETIYRLLPEWAGDLRSLLDAVNRL
jgi:hypothetical protein